MAKKQAYTVARGTFNDGSKVYEYGDAIRLDPDEGDRHVKNGDLIPGGPDAPAKDPAPAPDPYGLPKTLEPVEGRDEAVEIPGTEETRPVGALLKAAFDASGLKVADWNALGGEEITARIQAQADAIAIELGDPGGLFGKQPGDGGQ